MEDTKTNIKIYDNIESNTEEDITGKYIFFKNAKNFGEYKSLASFFNGFLNLGFQELPDKVNQETMAEFHGLSKNNYINILRNSPDYKTVRRRLSFEDDIDIFNAFSKNETKASLARRFNVSRNTITNSIKRTHKYHYNALHEQSYEPLENDQFSHTLADLGFKLVYGPDGNEGRFLKEVIPKEDDISPFGLPIKSFSNAMPGYDERYGKPKHRSTILRRAAMVGSLMALLTLGGYGMYRAFANTNNDVNKSKFQKPNTSDFREEVLPNNLEILAKETPVMIADGRIGYADLGEIKKENQKDVKSPKRRVRNAQIIKGILYNFGPRKKKTDPMSLPEGSDGIDNDGDNLIDMNDPGITTPFDDDERDIKIEFKFPEIEITPQSYVPLIADSKISNEYETLDLKVEKDSDVLLEDENSQSIKFKTPMYNKDLEDTRQKAEAMDEITFPYFFGGYAGNEEQLHKLLGLENDVEITYDMAKDWLKNGDPLKADLVFDYLFIVKNTIERSDRNWYKASWAVGSMNKELEKLKKDIRKKKFSSAKKHIEKIRRKSKDLSVVRSFADIEKYEEEIEQGLSQLVA